MSQISRLKDAEISNGNLINADDLDAEFNQLVNESNSQDTRIGNIENSNITLAGVKTFSSAPKTNQIDERTADNGVSVDGVVLKDGTVSPAVASDPVSPGNGTLWYNSTEHDLKARINGETKSLLGALPSGFMHGPAAQYVSAGSVKIPATFICRSADNSLDISFGSDATVSLASSGANGLDTGSEASDTWYYLWAIADSTGANNPAGLLSTSSSAPTMPTGYDKKRLLPLAVRNDSSGNLIPFYVAAGWPQRPTIMYQVSSTYYNGSSIVAGATNILFSGSSTSYTDLDFSSFVPIGISNIAVIKLAKAGTGGIFNIRKDGETNEGNSFGTGASSTDFYGLIFQPLASGLAEYRRYNGSGVAYIDAMGFIVTEVS